MHPGEQHLPQNDKSGQSNPFNSQPPSVTRMNARDIATLQARLDKQLGPEYISERPGAGGAKVHYLEAWKVINLANEVFGFNGWSSSIQNIAIDYMDENRESGRVSLGLSVVVRVTLRDGVYHEDIGYGSIENAKSKAAAFEKCKKEGTTDALKRALRNFGNVLGNCLYDKSYLREVSKIKPPPSRFDPNELHRRPEFTFPLRPTAGQHPKADRHVVGTATVETHLASEDSLFQDHFDDTYFDDYDFEDRPVLEESPRINEFDTHILPNKTATTESPPGNKSNADKMPLVGIAERNANLLAPGGITQQAAYPPQAQQSTTSSTSKPEDAARPQSSSPTNIAQNSPLQSVEVQAPGFIRIAKDGPTSNPFDHKAGTFSPLARPNSHGVDYGKSTPITRTKHHKAPLGNNLDAHNRMGQPPIGLNSPHRLVGCPPAITGGTALLNKTQSMTSLAGTKRNAQGQVIGGNIAGGAREAKPMMQDQREEKKLKN